MDHTALLSRTLRGRVHPVYTKPKHHDRTTRIVCGDEEIGWADVMPSLPLCNIWLSITTEIPSDAPEKLCTIERKGQHLSGCDAKSTHLIAIHVCGGTRSKPPPKSFPCLSSQSTARTTNRRTGLEISYRILGMWRGDAANPW